MTYVKTEQDKERNRVRKAEWYKENRETQYARVKANQQRIHDWIREYKRTQVCKECGFSGAEYPDAIDFHHRDPATKESNISSVYLKGWSLEKVKREIAKCDPLCATHHRIVHSLG